VEDACPLRLWGFCLQIQVCFRLAGAKPFSSVVSVSRVAPLFVEVLIALCVLSG
jgi:hypothetical protein